MNAFLSILFEFGLPIFAATVMGFFLYLKPDEDRISRADGKNDARRD